MKDHEVTGSAITVVVYRIKVPFRSWSPDSDRERHLLLIIGISGVVFGGACAIVASNKNRDAFGWFVLGFFFSLVALVVIAALTPLIKNESTEDASDKRGHDHEIPGRDELRRKSADLAASLARSKAKLNN